MATIEETTPLLELDTVTKSFGGLRALNGVSLQVRRGEVRSIIGPNGAGKTTLFNVITNFHQCTSGRVIYDGNDVTNVPASSLVNSGLVRTFQRSSIFPKLSVRDNVLVPLLRRHGFRWNMFRPAGRLLHEETMAVLESVGLAEQAATRSGGMSHGYQRRLELAIALANDPKLLLLDEPTAGMSVEESVQAMQLIVRLNQQRGLTILFTEHDMSVVFTASHRITVLDFGKVIAEGTPDEIRANPDVQRVYLGEDS